ncbi:FeoA family protein [Lapillicoccus jejuensis]|uniref:Fe2+ transport system protein FeoA n=1 Tax=Lapillicoccus jejuensis TaxID=402171 RepID=A0A542DZV7_9MICO|nr:FeoA family protein [Lapillicoccus jejuensis]TQJ08651.1 Fe2+ transport system protein FeoA [Lapillicoccus jejuensis]
MSLLTGLLSARVVDDVEDVEALTACRAAGTPTMADLRPGATATVTSVCAGTDAATSRRLFDLGFAPGVEVQLVRRAPMADPVVFRVAGYDIALRRAQARCVLVAPTQQEERESAWAGRRTRRALATAS